MGTRRVTQSAQLNDEFSFGLVVSVVIPSKSFEDVCAPDPSRVRRIYGEFHARDAVIRVCGGSGRYGSGCVVVSTGRDEQYLIALMVLGGKSGGSDGRHRP